MLNVSRQIYAAWSVAPTKSLPEVTIVPHGDTTNEKKKLSKATSKYLNIKEFENTALPGFTLHKPDRQYRGSADMSWLVIDPRGYLVRITNDNLSDILLVTGITEGLIQERCIWARQDSQTKLTLVPISSPDYQLAQDNTKLLEDKVSRKDIQIGDEVLLQNGKTGIYKGIISLYGPLTNMGYSGSTSTAKVYPRRQVVELSPNNYFYQADTKILKVTKVTLTPGTKQQVMKELNDGIQAKTANFTSYTDGSPQTLYSTHGMISFASTDTVTKATLKLVEIDINEAAALFKEAFGYSDTGVLLFEAKNCKQYMANFMYGYNNSIIPDPISFNAVEIDALIDEFSISRKNKKQVWGYKSTETHKLDFFAKFYKIVKHVKNNTYI